MEALLLPTDRHVGAAAFVRSNTLFVVMDSAKPIDLSSITGNTTFGEASFLPLPSGAVFNMRLRPGMRPSVWRESSGWMIGFNVKRDQDRVISPQTVGDTVSLPVDEPGHVVVVPDGTTGSRLLVGTVQAWRPGARSGVPRCKLHNSCNAGWSYGRPAF